MNRPKLMMNRFFFPLVSIILLPSVIFLQETPPIIDMHLHARNAPDPVRVLCLPVTVYGVIDPKCKNPILSPTTDQDLVNKTIDIMNKRNIIGVISGYPLELVNRFRKAAPNRLIPAYQLNLGTKYLSAKELRPHFKSGSFQVLGEIENQYIGMTPGDERMEPYWKLAEELDIPVALHLGEGYPGAPYLGSPKYRVALGSPLLLEEVLIRHPKLRIYIMHYGSPLVDEMIGIMYTYPQVYIDIGGNVWPYPKEYFYSQLKKFIDAGFGKRIMFGSDQMVWPSLMEISIKTVEDAPFLSREQKRDIFYNNAARFLRFSKEEINSHHGR